MSAGVLELLDCANGTRLVRPWRWIAVAAHWLTALMLVFAVVALVAHAPSAQMFTDAGCMFAVSLFAHLFVWGCETRQQFLSEQTARPTAEV